MPHRKKTRRAIHITAVSIILLLPIVDAPTPVPSKILLFANPYLPIDFLLHLLSLVFGYLNYYVLIPRFFYAKFKLQYALSVFALFLLLAGTPLLVFYEPIIDYVGINENIYIHELVQMRHGFFLFGVVFLYSLTSWTENQRRKTELEIRDAEMRSLKAQVNPHFLFNSLNTIYAQLQFDPKRASDSLIKMSAIMRYVIEASRNTYETLPTTLKYLENYIDLQKQRFENTILVEYQNTTEDIEQYSLAPLLLIPFVENAFKYGLSPQGFCTIVIRVSNEGNLLHLFVENKDYSHLMKDSPLSTGIGIENTQKRLEMLYPGRFELNYGSKNGLYTVNLLLRMDMTNALPKQ